MREKNFSNVILLTIQQAVIIATVLSSGGVSPANIREKAYSAKIRSAWRRLLLGLL